MKYARAHGMGAAAGGDERNAQAEVTIGLHNGTQSRSAEAAPASTIHRPRGRQPIVRPTEVRGPSPFASFVSASNSCGSGAGGSSSRSSPPSPPGSVLTTVVDPRARPAGRRGWCSSTRWSCRPRRPRHHTTLSTLLVSHVCRSQEHRFRSQRGLASLKCSLTGS